MGLCAAGLPEASRQYLLRHNLFSRFTIDVIEFCEAHSITWGVECSRLLVILIARPQTRTGLSMLITYRSLTMSVSRSWTRSSRR